MGRLAIATGPFFSILVWTSRVVFYLAFLVFFIDIISLRLYYRRHLILR